MNETDVPNEESKGHDGPFPMDERTREETLYAENISFMTLCQGQNGPDEAINSRFVSEQQLQSIMPNLQQLLDRGITIDWTKEDIIIVALGKKPTSGWKVEIRQVLRLEDAGPGHPDVANVYYRETKPSAASNDVITSPAHAIKIQKLDCDIHFFLENQAA